MHVVSHQFQEWNSRIWILEMKNTTSSSSPSFRDSETSGSGIFEWHSLSSFFFSHATCLQSPAAYNFTLCNFLHLSGFLSKEERGPKNGRTIKALDVGLAAEMWRGFHVLSVALLDPRLSAPLLHSCIYSWGLSQATASSAVSSGLVLPVDLNS